jgi:predicted ATPase
MAVGTAGPGSGIAPSYVFLSYASADRERAFRVADLLEASGISVWLDRKSIAAGSSWSAEIVRGIKGCQALLVLVSVTAMASANVQQEVQLAWESHRPILPLLQERVVLPASVEYALAGRQWVELLERPEEQWLPETLRACELLSAGTITSALLAPAPQPPPAAPAPASLAAPPAPVRHHNLPAALTSFIGRERELAEIGALLGQARLVTLVGVGGTGKTRLALEVAGQLAAQYPDGIWFVELAPLADPALVLTAVAAAVSVREEVHRPLTETLLAAWRDARLLLLLDNCEHLLDACAHLADTLLRGCLHVQVLATSREALGISGETSWRISSLRLPDATEQPELDDLRQNEAVRLFLERAAAVNARVQLTQQNAPAVVQICRRLDGIPLALELAAARLRAMTIEQLAARMDQRFRLLTGGSRAALPRQQTLQALVDWSYDLLPEPERRLFQRLSVFSGGFTLEAAEAVGCGDEVEAVDVLDLLAQLVGKSLVLAEEQPDGSQRYGLLETLRQYGREKLVPSGDAEAVHSRHAAYYVALAAEAVPPGAPPAREDWREYLTPEHDNLRGALGWLIERQDVAQVPILAWPVAYLWAVSGNYSEGRRQFAAILALPGLAGPTKQRAEMLFCASFFAARVGEFAIAAQLGEERLAIARQLDDPRPIAHALTFLGVNHVQLGDYARAQELQEQSLTIWQQLGDQAQTADVLIRLGEVAHMLGDYDRAELRYSEGLQTARASSVHEAIGRALHHLGSLALDTGDFPRAHEYFSESVRVHWQHRHLFWFHYALADIASLAAAEGQAERALRLGGASTAYATARESAIQPSERGRFEHWMATARRQLPAVQADAAWTQGVTMPLEAAFVDALADDAPGDGARVR